MYNVYSNFPKKNITSWMANGSFIETYENPQTTYKMMLTIYSEDMQSVLYSNTYDINSAKTTIIDKIKPSSTAAMFQLSPRFVITDLTSYAVVGKKNVLQVHIMFAKNVPPMPVTFSKSQRFSNRRAEFTIPLMSDYMEIHLV
jgi:hypothetical protein